jgi:hypothetical protein
MGSPDWSPDGQRIVGTVTVADPESLDSELVILDVGALLSEG